MSKLESFSPICIVGAGPAGLHGAIELAKYGVKTTVIDENSQIGGVVFRGPLRKKWKSEVLDGKVKEQREFLRTEYQRHSGSIQLLLETQVLGSLGEKGELALYHKERGLTILEYEQLITSTGCHERAIPFPGWRLPGVMTLGGVQLQVKSGLVRPGQEIALVGTGPLLLVVAKQLHLAGVKVLGVYEAMQRSYFVKKGFSLMKNLSLAQEGVQYLSYLKKAKIPLHYGWGIVKAQGAEALQQVTVAPYDKHWKPILSKKQDLSVDCLGVEYGFVSRSQLTQLLGVKHEFEKNSGLRPIVDAWQCSSNSKIYVAGDIAGIYGNQAASEQGKIAALGILRQRGILSSQEVEKIAHPYRKKLKQYISFRDAFDEPAELHEKLLDLPQEDTVICRCEKVTRQEIDQAIGTGIQDMGSLKMKTRISMGDCQGKLCGSFCYSYLKKKLQKDEVGVLNPRFPLFPIPFGAMIKKEENVKIKEDRK